MSRDCDDGCGELANERLRYFTGRHMTARDFRDEQAYHRTHRLLHNRMLHDWGVVCGLHVRQHKNSDCRSKYVLVDCGFALDCCGREIPLPKQSAVEIPWADQPQAPDDGGLWYLLVCLQYDEQPTEPLPVLYNEQNCDPQRREHTRIREGWQLEAHWIRKADLPSYHWKTVGGDCPEPPDGPPCVEDDCDGGEHPSHCCLEPQCPPHHCVPLALISIKQKGQQIADADIDMSGRPALKPPRQALTRICHTNWTHGSTVTRKQVQDTLSQLRIRFNRRLKPATGDPSYGPNGVNECTFLVQFGGDSEDLDFVETPVDAAPPHTDYDCIAVFDMNPGKSSKLPFAYLENHTVFVTLHCDFILDCHDVAVDGNHLGGVLPSGDGVPGGTFLSWFHVIPDNDSQQMQKEQP